MSDSTNTTTTESPPVCDYEGSNYRTRFWEDQGRSYEDQVERIALRRLLPPAGGNLIDIGAGYGRLAPEFHGYKRVVLFDFSKSLLEEAQNRIGEDPRFLFVAGNWYSMPFLEGVFDTMVQVRTIHHAADVPSLFGQLARIARPDGTYILEFANKHNLKAILRYWTGRQRWSPFSPHPIEFAELNFDFHPRWMSEQLRASGFLPGRKLTVSHFRLPVLKRLVPTGVLSSMDGFIQPSGELFQLSPSVFVSATAPREGVSASPDSVFACPDCLTPLGDPVDDLLICHSDRCGARWSAAGNIYDFKNRLGKKA